LIVVSLFLNQRSVEIEKKLAFDEEVTGKLTAKSSKLKTPARK
jgi:hypothetical protein